MLKSLTVQGPHQGKKQAERSGLGKQSVQIQILTLPLTSC